MRIRQFNMIKSVILVYVFFLIVEKVQSQDSWQIPITIKCEGWTTTLFLGASSNATENYDAGLDRISPPPGFSPYGYFYIEDFPNLLSSDIKYSGSENTWNIRTSNCQGKTVVIKWDLDDFTVKGGDAGSLLIIDHATLANIDSLVLIGDISLDIHSSYVSKVEDQNLLADSRSDEIIIYPNPFNNSTKIEIDGLIGSKRGLAIYDILGRKVKTLFEGEFTLSNNVFWWDGTNDLGMNCPSGIYLVVMRNYFGAKSATVIFQK
jgi:hypothetical protein